MATTRTSTTHPIRVDWLEGISDALGPGKGKIGLTIAPGKKGPAFDGFVWDRDLAQDLDRLIDEYDAAQLICLMEQDELIQYRMDGLLSAAAERGLGPEHGPIRDLQCPTCEQADHLTNVALSAARAGKNVIIHCRGGLGRAGTIGACCYVALGIEPAKAIKQVRASRRGTVETQEQERFVSTFHAWLGSRPSPSTSLAP